jgi:hypothetical protein
MKETNIVPGDDTASTWSVHGDSCEPRFPVASINPGKTISANKHEESHSFALAA